MLTPWSQDEDGRTALVEEAKALVGQTVAQVTYVLLRDLASPELWSLAEGDDVDIGLELRTHEGTVFSAVWRTAGYNAGLLLTRGPLQPPATDTESVDVTTTQRWRSRIGRKIRDVRLGWHTPSERAVEAVWAVDLQFEDSGMVMIALGTLIEGHLHYSVDNIVVLFSERVAGSYRPLSSAGSPIDA